MARPVHPPHAAPPGSRRLNDYVADFTVINCPTFKADPKRHDCRSDTVIALNFDRKLILIGNTEYAGENKKSVFTLLNYLLPEKGIMPMHCSANHAKDNPVDAAVFFGLSGTGKTTLSADPDRVLIGDDEHGWSDNGTSTSRRLLRQDHQPQPRGRAGIYATTGKFGTVIENMVYDEETKELDLRMTVSRPTCGAPTHCIISRTPRKPPSVATPKHHHADL